MNIRYTLAIVLSFLSLSTMAQNTKTEILILGSDHFPQFYKKSNPNTDVLEPRRQAELAEVVQAIGKYAPDMVMVESLPESQGKLDSLYKLYNKRELVLSLIDNGRDEIYQLAFPIARRSGLAKIHAVNAPGGALQNMLDNGEHIELYKQAGAAWKKTLDEKYAAIANGSLSMRDYISFLNKPEYYNQVYRLRYVVPARVMNGKFKNTDKKVDTAAIDQKYIGAELISMFKNRDYKIYSNIVNAQASTKAKRILLIVGASRVGALRAILRDDPQFDLTSAGDYLR